MVQRDTHRGVPPTGEDLGQLLRHGGLLGDGQNLHHRGSQDGRGPQDGAELKLTG